MRLISGTDEEGQATRRDKEDEKAMAEDVANYPLDGPRQTETGNEDMMDIERQKDNKEQTKNVKLYNYKDAEYIGDIFLGFPS